MAEVFVRKLIGEVINAKKIMPKDGQGTASTYAIVDFDGQRRLKCNFNLKLILSLLINSILFYINKCV
jgi:hypothetical protein